MLKDSEQEVLGDASVRTNSLKRMLTVGHLSIALSFAPFVALLILGCMSFERLLESRSLAVLFLGSVLLGLAGAVLGFRSIVRNTRRQPGRDPAQMTLGLIAWAVFVIGFFFFPPMFHKTLMALSFSMTTSSMDPIFRRVESQSLEVLHEGYERYAQEASDGLLPPLSNTPGRLMQDAEGLPDYLKYMGYVARSHPDFRRMVQQYRGSSMDHFVDDWSYFYLGYDIRSDEQMAAFAAVYKERAGKESAFNNDLPCPAFPNGLIARLNLRLLPLPPDATRPPLLSELPWREIPLLIGRIEHNDNRGAQVLYLDGHVEFLDYPGRWPMTEKTVALLRELDQMREMKP